MQARRTGSTSSGGKLQQGSYNKQALAAALSWQHTSLTDKNAEGSATSDEDHPRYCLPSASLSCLKEDCPQMSLLQGLPCYMHKEIPAIIFAVVSFCKGQYAAACSPWSHSQFASSSTVRLTASSVGEYDLALRLHCFPRLVPRRGAGPELRNSGREIDEYLMRLLHAGAVDPSQDAVFHNLVGP